MTDQAQSFHCPSHAEILRACLALLPRGRAWQTHEGGPHAGADIAFEPGAFNGDAFSVTKVKASILRLYWQAVAGVFAFITQRLCDLRLEFWCATHIETNDLWMLEYGLPDACDPFPDLCTKVAAIGGTRCDYYAAIAERAGWSIACVEIPNSCGARAGCSRAGFARPGRSSAGQFRIVVDLPASPGWTGTRRKRAMAGSFKAGQRLSCGPDIGPLECLLARVVHADIQISYEVIA